MTYNKRSILILMTFIAMTPELALAKNSDAEAMFGLVIALIMGIVAFIALNKTEKQLNDPNDTEIIYIDQIEENSNLNPAKQFLVHIYRQSGNPQQNDRVIEAEGGNLVPPQEAIKLALKTLRRAKIDHVRMIKNTTTTLQFERPLHQHGGKQEGKKVRGATIVALDER